MRKASTALAALVAGIGIQAIPSPVWAQSPTSARQTDTVRAIRAAEAAVVNIEGNKPSGKGAGEPQQVNGMGSGVIIDSRGYIPDQSACRSRCARIEVTLHDGSKFIGNAMAHDPSTDLLW